MNEFSTISVSADALLRTAVPTEADLAYGYQEGLLSAKGVVDVALELVKRGVDLSDPMTDIAYLLRDDFERVGPLLEGVGKRPFGPDVKRFWIYVCLRLATNDRPPLEALAVAAELFEAFDYDLSFQPFVPPLAPRMPSTDELIDRLDAFLGSEKNWVTSRAATTR